MTRRVFEAACDCTARIKDLMPDESKIKEMLSFLSRMDGLAEICELEGPSGLRLEAGNLPEDTLYEKAFKESICMWINGSSTEEAADHAADKYFEDKPAGYDAAIYYAAVYGVSNILRGELACGFIDEALQYLLPDGWRWREEDEKEKESHKDDKDWSQYSNNHRIAFFGDPQEEVRHRFDDIKICNLITEKDQISVEIGKRIGDRLSNYANGALQLILKKLTYPELEKALYVLPGSAEDRIVSNLSSYCIPIIKGDCILNKDSVSTIDILVAIARLEKAMNAYDEVLTLVAEFEW